MRIAIAAFIAAALLSGCSRKVQQKEIGPAPAIFRVNFDTSKGPFIVEVHRDWAPLGADRFYELVVKKFYDNNRFFRIVPGFVVQFGINGNPDVMEYWRPLAIPDDPVKEPNAPGTICFAKSGPATRTTQVFINLANNSQMLDPQGFSVFGRVTQGMDVIANLYSGYGEAPQQDRIQVEGNQYLSNHFPNLDYIRTARVVPQ